MYNVQYIEHEHRMKNIILSSNLFTWNMKEEI